MSIKSLAFTLLPHHFLSALMGYFTRCRWRWLKDWHIRTFLRVYDVDMTESLVEEPSAYPHFQEFFTRRLKPEARPVADSLIVSPVDGLLTDFGAIQEQRILMAKQKPYTVETLLGEDHEVFHQGQFATFYLAPGDYHRVHMPTQGKLTKMRHIPGRLFTVNPTLLPELPPVFTRNERLACFFDTPQGPLALIFIAALFVGNITTTWHGPVGAKPSKYFYDPAMPFSAGDELGFFTLGSSVMILTNFPDVSWQETLHTGKKVKMGEALI